MEKKNKAKAVKDNYNASDIQIIEHLDHVRKRPGMYIGGTGTKGLHHLVWEIIDNAIDEGANGHGSDMSVIMKLNGAINITDNGRGIPIGIHPIMKIPAARLVFEKLGSGAKFNDLNYNTSGGLHGVGASVVNALSEWMTINIKRDGYEYLLEYKHQKTDGLIKGKKTNETGTSITFYPDKEIFPEIDFKQEVITSKLRELSFLNKGMRLHFKNEKSGKEKMYISENGLADYLEFVCQGKDTVSKPLIIGGRKGEVEAEIAMQYVDSYTESIYSYVNNIQTQGGTHEIGFKEAVRDAINKYIANEGNKTWQRIPVQTTDIMEGIVSIISVKMKDPEFEGQTKEKLGNPQIKAVINEIVSDEFYEYLLRNKSNAKTIVEKILVAAESRENAKKARELTRAKNDATKKNVIIAKLAYATSKNSDEKEIYIVEGDSAGGSAKTARNRRTQAVLPLRGKPLNSEKKNLHQLLLNEEMKSMILAFGAGVGEDFNIAKMNYRKIIIMTDADVDGQHIVILLLTFFYRHMRPLIENGYVYIANPPLYKVYNDKNHVYAYDDITLEKAKKKIGPRYKIQRYKGLGEMDAKQLYDTTMDPERRTLTLVTIDNSTEADSLFSMLMGNNAEVKRKFIEEN